MIDERGICAVDMGAQQTQLESMKRYLYLVRHAKAEDYAATSRDFDRELTAQGIMSAARMGRFLKEKGLVAHLMVSSQAARAYQTAKVMAEQLDYNVDTIENNPFMYEGGARAYLAAVNALDNAHTHVMLFGHNPDISFFAEYLTNQHVGSMGKGSVAVVEFDAEVTWDMVSQRSGRLLSYESPKSLAQ